MKRQEFDGYIKENDFASLFNQMGWNNSNQVIPTIAPVEEKKYYLNCVAQRNGFKVYTCEVETIPLMTVIKAVDKRLRKSSNDYILIFISTTETMHHEWIVPVKTVDKRVLVPVEYTTTAQLDFLYSKHSELSFGIEEESTILDVTKKVHSAFELNSEKITKDFYAGFKKQHNQFAEFISGIDVEGDKQWYVSVMLNRLMFCYFIQKKNFLDFNPNYLRDKLNECKAKKGKDKFFKSFYKSFLVQLFQGGLNTPSHETNEFRQTFGRIPYLNGGMFDQHQLEKQYENIDIADEAFENLFDFFDKYKWHLDTRIEASGKDINPDVLGYIFEQYINDRAQMGAYYTKEDITNYIGKNCILPFLWDKTLNTAGADSNSVWDFLKKSGDTYIYDAVKHGLKDENGKLKELPENIVKGLDTTKPKLIERRKDWNTPTQEDFALQTEIWRETVERRNRYIELCEMISACKITTINDFITYNLDIVRFTQDYLQNTNNMKQVLVFYHAMQNVTILDPTCGSGAFLFAAMNILEPLYDICLDRMEEVSDNTAIKAELDEIKNNYRSNRAYYIYKSIILKNLYGVDIMNEATEIAKLRLFLKMVAVVEADNKLPNLGLDPLPDIDFNIRCGNTLVGYANKKELFDSFKTNMIEAGDWKEKTQKKVNEVSATYKIFKEWQLKQTDSIEDFKIAKKNLSISLEQLNNTLNQRLFGSRAYTNIDYNIWLRETKPFHWFAEFYEIIQENGGFDIIIGNPPYLEQRQINYTVNDYETGASSAVHAYCIERSSKLLNESGIVSMIVPLAIVCTQRMIPVQKILERNGIVWYSNYAWRPAKLFDAVNRALSIFIARKTNEKHVFSTGYTKWTSEIRSDLFQRIIYCNYDVQRDSFWVPKLKDNLEQNILNKILNSDYELFELISASQNNHFVYYRTTGGLYWKIFTNFSPKFYLEGKEGKSSRETNFAVRSKEESVIMVAVLSSDLFWYWYTVTSNLRDLNPSDISGFRIAKSVLSDNEMQKLGTEFLEDIQRNSTMLTRVQKGKGETKTQSFKISLSKTIIDKIDTRLAKHYDFTEEELDFIINYDIKYRMGNELEEE